MGRRARTPGAGSRGTGRVTRISTPGRRGPKRTPPALLWRDAKPRSRRCPGPHGLFPGPGSRVSDLATPSAQAASARLGVPRASVHLDWILDPRDSGLELGPHGPSPGRVGRGVPTRSPGPTLCPDPLSLRHARPGTRSSSEPPVSTVLVRFKTKGDLLANPAGRGPGKVVCGRFREICSSSVPPRQESETLVRSGRE